VNAEWLASEAVTWRRHDWGILRVVAEYRFTDYFEKEVLRKRPYLKKEWCIRVIEKPIRSEPQERVTIHNAFPDRRFKP